MATRRTRRGTLLEGDCRGIKPQQIHSKRQNLTPPMNSISAVKNVENQSKTETSNSNVVNTFPPSSSSNKPQTPLNTENVCKKENIWRNEMYEKDRVSRPDFKPNDTNPKVLTEIVGLGNATDTQEIPKKSRKPEILVSLLENEAYPCVKLKVKSEEKREYEDEKKRPLTPRRKCHGPVNKFREEDTFHSSSKPVCFFPYCEHHSKETFKADFLPISKVPEEPFLVSLSKDKNKELNMVTTSSGTVRVGPGCSMRRLLPSSQPFSGTSVSKDKKCVNSTDLEIPKEGKENNKLGCLLSEVSKAMSQSQTIRQTSQCISKQRDLISKENLSSGACSINVPSLKTVNSDLGIIHEEKKDDVEELNNNQEKVSCKQSLNINIEEDTGQEHRQQFQCKHDPAIPKDASFSKTRKMTFCPLKNSSAHNREPQPLPASSTCSDKRTEDVSDKSKMHCKGPVSLLKATVCLTKTSIATPVNTTDTCSKSDSQSVIKRSERIRCKSNTPAKTSANIEKAQSVTEKQFEQKSKVNLKCADWITPKIKTSLKKKSLKTIKSISNKAKKGICGKKSKALHKVKNKMTRKVMDGIVQSIEETVLRASQDDSFRDTKKSEKENVDEQNCSNPKPGLSTGLSYSKKLSGSSFPQINEKDAARGRSFISNSTTAQASCHKKNLLKGQKANQKTNKVSKDLPKLHENKLPKVEKSQNQQSKMRLQPNAHPYPLETKTDEANISADSSSKLASPISENMASGGASHSFSTSATKRSRKKTKKAKEALTDTAVTWKVKHPFKKSKSKKRRLSETDSSSNTAKRPRKNSQLGELMANPVLEEHAFTLWASENRSQIELQHPTASTGEVDAILSSRWCDVLGSVKARFFLRAREALRLSDGDRHFLQTSSVKEMDPLTGPDQYLDRDPLFIEFVRLPVDKQRDMLRKWLKFFQKMLPKKEYTEFIVTFKNACGESEASVAVPGKPVKRPRMRCLDPSHYRMLFDMIRLTRPRIVEVCKEKKGKDKKIISQTYSMIVEKLVCGEPWPEASITTCQSQSLTQVLLDLNIYHCNDAAACTSYCATTSPGMLLPDCSKTSNLSVVDSLEENLFTDAEAECGVSNTTFVTLGLEQGTWSNTQGVEKQIDGEFPCDLQLDETDYTCLNSDFAQSLLSGLSQLSELPVIDQSTLDQVFLAPPCKDARCIQGRRGGGGSGAGGMASYCTVSSACPSHPLQAAQSSIYPKMNIHHPPMFSGLDPRHHHQHIMLPVSSARGSSLFATGQYVTRDTIKEEPISASLSSPSLSTTYRRDSLMDMHSYSISVDDNTTSTCVGSHSNLCSVGPPNLPSKFIKAYSKTGLGPSAKLNVQALHLPQTSKAGSCFLSTRSGGYQVCSSSRQQRPKIIPSCTEHQHQHHISSHLVSALPSEPMSSKPKAHHVMPAKFGSPACPTKASCSSASLVSSCAKFYSHHGGLGPSSPLITSLSPLRNVKYQGQVSTKLYNSSPCTMMPFRPRMQFTDTLSHCHRRATHTVPISTTLNTFGSARAPGSNIQQIKVCLPTQALKIPIAKLRGTKKSTYIKGKLKNVGLLPPGSDAMGNISCIPQQGCKPSSSVLAKVLSFQVKNEAVCAGGEYKSPVITEVSYASPKLSPTATTFIGTMRSMGSHFDSSYSGTNCYRSSKKVQLISVDSYAGHSRSLGSTHTAVIVSPMSVHKRGLAGLQHQTPLSSSLITTSRSTIPIASDSNVFTTAGLTYGPDHLPSSYRNHSSLITESHQKTSGSGPSLTSINETCASAPRDRKNVRLESVPVSEDEEDNNCGSQFVVVGTRTTCLPIPKKRVHTMNLEEDRMKHKCETSTVNHSVVCTLTYSGLAEAHAHRCYDDTSPASLHSHYSGSAQDGQLDSCEKNVSPQSTDGFDCQLESHFTGESTSESIDYGLNVKPPYDNGDALIFDKILQTNFNRGDNARDFQEEVKKVNILSGGETFCLQSSCKEESNEDKNKEMLLPTMTISALSAAKYNECNDGVTQKTSNILPIQNNDKHLEEISDICKIKNDDSFLEEASHKGCSNSNDRVAKNSYKVLFDDSYTFTEENSRKDVMEDSDRVTEEDSFRFGVEDNGGKVETFFEAIKREATDKVTVQLSDTGCKGNSEDKVTETTSHAGHGEDGGKRAEPTSDAGHKENKLTETASFEGQSGYSDKLTEPISDMSQSMDNGGCLEVISDAGQEEDSNELTKLVSGASCGENDDKLTQSTSNADDRGEGDGLPKTTFDAFHRKNNNSLSETASDANHRESSDEVTGKISNAGHREENDTETSRDNI